MCGQHRDINGWKGGEMSRSHRFVSEAIKLVKLRDFVNETANDYMSKRALGEENKQEGISNWCLNDWKWMKNRTQSSTLIGWKPGSERLEFRILTQKRISQTRNYNSVG